MRQDKVDLPQAPPWEQVVAQVRLALAEDLGSGDLTAGLIPAAAQSTVTIRSREEAVLCGRSWLEAVFRELDAAMRIHWGAVDGDRLAADQVFCTLQGSTRALLSGERTALNFLQTLSGTATQARRLRDYLGDSPVRLLDTRKTLPGLRLAQKYAVACGGCANHRLGLYDAILIKENHIQAAGGITAALRAAQGAAAGVEIEVEVENLAQLDEALGAGARRVLLDNFSLDQLRAAVAHNQGRARLEASGNVNWDNLPYIAATGVDDISLGALTKDVKAVDLSMRFVETRLTGD